MESRTTFAQLITNRGRVQIPIIQRDYAQGRVEQKDVRNDFLRALHDALSWPPDDARLPLDLDFVYGNDVSGAFQPLDGQQRLTTLFLLHWYLAWVDGKLDDFQARFVADGRSRFGYQVRPSSKDFVDEMAGFDPGPFQPEIDLAALIKDRQWYVRAWQYDQTVRSALDMLGAMHVEFGQSSNLYERLIDPENPAVCFQLLDLEDFTLTDELYIKMNARGKPLTPFETFKARFEQHLKVNFADLELPQCGGEPVGKFFATRMDREWSDFFWRYRDKQTATFDVAIMNLLRVLIIVTRDPERGTITDAELAELRGAMPSTFTAFNERGWLDRGLVTALVSLFECWSGQDRDLPTYLPDDCPFDLSATFRQIISDPSRLTFQDLAIFAGYVQFVTAAQGNINESAFGDWMRVVFNLGVNTDYNGSDDLRRSFAGLADMRPGLAGINSFLLQPGVSIGGFLGSQVREERVKAHLIGLGDGWPQRITAAERHDYLKGQIGFLLLFAGFDLGAPNHEPVPPASAEAHDAIEAFDHYFACVRQMLKDLTEAGDDGRAWELALISVGDILLEAGRNSALPSFKEGQGSWKRLLRVAAAGDPQGDVLKGLWDRLSDPADAKEVLTEIIETEWDDEAWRRVIIATPAIIKYCRERLIRFDDERGIYPLKRSQMNGAHVELYTYAAYAAVNEAGGLKSLTMEYYETFSAEEPSLGLDCTIGGKKYEFLLMSRQDYENYDLWLHHPKSPATLVAALLAEQGFAIDDGFLSKALEWHELRSAILDLDAALVHVVAQKVA
ncbi:DUF262 domain-containing protein [Rhizobium leguminosarum]|uniref:DUF262 domain-containing protein n=1 Tax=Rhizobium leguminosarum TaxID=384 RepID=UPI001C95B8B5|nr:DUF262 domain-containing protein [Rhizobium leguminosarum]MBY5603910.1 DUF262 domain-containing protein [Rhizobium leguminosarum]